MADPQVVAAMQGLVRNPTEMSDFTDEAHAITGDPASAPPPNASLRGCRRTDPKVIRLIGEMTAEKRLVSVRQLAS